MTISTDPKQWALERIYGYAQDVCEGRLVACNKVIMSCRRFLSDLEKSKDPAYPWRFDEDLAARPIRFIERFLRPTKGSYNRMELMPWQCFVEGNLYGWVHKETGLRRFREALIAMGRKNGKSTLMAGNASYLATKDGEYGADVYLLANSKAQAGIVYDTCRTQIMASPALAAEFRPLRDGLYYDKTHSKICHLASDSLKLDGLNPHGAIFDELEEYRKFTLLNVIRNGMGGREQPLLLMISTMGTVLDGPLTYYYGLFTDAMQEGMLETSVADSMFAFICELDSEAEINDPDSWIKANPSLGVLIDLERMKVDWQRAQKVPQERSDFITKRLNVMCDASDTVFAEAEVLNRNRAKYDTDGLLGRMCYGGYDLSSREDFTAAALEFQLDDGRLYWLQHSWIPRRKVELDNEKIPYYEWAMKGYLTIVEGEYVEQPVVYEWFREMGKRYAIQCIGYDPANASWLNRMLETEFKTQIVRQGPLTLNDPMKDIHEKLLDGRIVSNDDEMLRWYMHNVRLRNDFRDREKENWYPTKRNRYRKIDGFMACLDAHAIGMEMTPVYGGENVRADIRIYEL